MNGKKWTAIEDSIISERYPNSTINEIMEELPGRTWRAIYSRAALLRVKKSPEFLLSEKCGRLYKSHDKGKTHQFKKGQTAWNKGMKGLQLGGEKGWFKKGNIPPNTKPEGDGAITIRKNKGIAYKYIRIALGKWRQLHTHTWEQANGRHIPEGHIVVFKDGDTMNCALENLEMISYEENMQRNSRHRYPEQVNELIQIKAVFTRKLNQIKKKYGNKN